MIKMLILTLVSSVTSVVAHYHIIQQNDIDKYIIVRKTTATTITECILKCMNENNCSIVATQSNRVSSMKPSCILLMEKNEDSNETSIAFAGDNDNGQKKNVLIIGKPKKENTFEHLNNTSTCTSWSEFQCETTCSGISKCFRNRTCTSSCGKKTEYDVETLEQAPCKVRQYLESSNPITIRCVNPTTLKIISASYGRPICLVDVLQKTRSSCQDKHVCQLRPKHQVFGVGDPCPGKVKYLFISYTCHTSIHK